MRRLAVWLIHWEAKGGRVSGAREGAPDSVMHVEVERESATTVFWQKAAGRPSLHFTRGVLARRC